MIQKILKMLLQLFDNIKDLIITGACIGTLAEIGVLLFIIFTGYELELLTVVVTYLFAVLIGITIALEMKNN